MLYSLMQKSNVCENQIMLSQPSNDLFPISCDSNNIPKLIHKKSTYVFVRISTLLILSFQFDKDAYCN